MARYISYDFTNLVLSYHTRRKEINLQRLTSIDTLSLFPFNVTYKNNEIYFATVIWSISLRITCNRI